VTRVHPRDPAKTAKFLRACLCVPSKAEMETFSSASMPARARKKFPPGIGMRSSKRLFYICNSRLKASGIPRIIRTLPTA
jgi:hypothetical protein